MPALVNFDRGHRFAAYPRCSADVVTSMADDEPPRRRWYEIARRETYYYILFGVPATTAILGILLVAGTPTILVWSFKAYVSLAIDAAVFAFILFACGIPGNTLFVLVCRGRLYVPGDPIVDWLPWVPSGDWIVGKADGGRYLPGGSAARLRLCWTILAIPTWSLAWWLYRIWQGVR
jgi:hypothetical protein